MNSHSPAYELGETMKRLQNGEFDFATWTFFALMLLSVDRQSGSWEGSPDDIAMEWQIHPVAFRLAWQRLRFHGLIAVCRLQGSIHRIEVLNWNARLQEFSHVFSNELSVRMLAAGLHRHHMFD